MDCVETAMFKGQSQEEIKRLLHMVVVGGGPTGVEFAGELQDFFNQDLKKWIPDIHENFHVTLVEALPNVRSNLSFDSPPFFFSPHTPHSHHSAYPHCSGDSLNWR